MSPPYYNFLLFLPPSKEKVPCVCIYQFQWLCHKLLQLSWYELLFLCRFLGIGIQEGLDQAFLTGVMWWKSEDCCWLKVLLWLGMHIPRMLSECPCTWWLGCPYHMASGFLLNMWSQKPKQNLQCLLWPNCQKSHIVISGPFIASHRTNLDSFWDRIAQGCKYWGCGSFGVILELAAECVLISER